MPRLQRIGVTGLATATLGVLAMAGTRPSSLFSRPVEPARASSPLRRAFERGVDSLTASLDTLAASIAHGSRDDVQRSFRAARTAYKHQEALLAYYSPSVVSVANGPPADEDDETPPRPLGSVAAFQRVEQRVFANAELTPRDRAAARADVRMMRDAVAHFRSHTALIDVRESQVLDAARTELARVCVVSMAGVDTDASSDGILEAAASLEGVRSIAAVAASGATAAPPASWQALDSLLGRAIHALHSAADFDSMDRLAFIVDYANPVGHAIQRVRREVAPQNLPVRSVWRPEAATLFEANAFDASAYAPDFAIAATPDVVALGERLFNDVRLSGPQTRSCASCHLPRLAFSDGASRHSAIGDASRHVARNTPTVLNAALQPTLFADGRAKTLEGLIAKVLASPEEMSSSADLVASRLSSDATYRDAFAHAYSAHGDSDVTAGMLRAVLAAYIRSLVTLESPFDAAVRGDANALTQAERRGFAVFMGKGRCGTCHFAPLFNGAMPPTFTTAEPEIIGTPVRPDSAGAVLDADKGRGGVDGVGEHAHAFKVPTLRNVALTAPYMHNGAYATLEQVVDFYNRGGGAGIGTDVPAQTLARRALHLTETEQHDLIAFLKALTDRRVAGH